MNWLIFTTLQTHVSHKHPLNDHEMFHFVVAESSKSIKFDSTKTSVFRFEIDFYVQPTNYRALSANSTCKHTLFTHALFKC